MRPAESVGILGEEQAKTAPKRSGKHRKGKRTENTTGRRTIQRSNIQSTVNEEDVLGEGSGQNEQAFPFGSSNCLGWSYTGNAAE